MKCRNRVTPLQRQVHNGRKPRGKAFTSGLKRKFQSFQTPFRAPDLPLIIAVTNALAQGMPRSQVIKEVLGCRGKKYQEGCDLFDRIKSIIEENS
jgi:hypothetical protein